MLLSIFGVVGDKQNFGDEFGELVAGLSREDGVPSMHYYAVTVLVHLNLDLVVLGNLFQFGPAEVHEHIEIPAIHHIGHYLRVEGDDQGIVGEHGCCLPHSFRVYLTGV